MSPLRFEPGISWIQVTIFAAWKNSLDKVTLHWIPKKWSKGVDSQDGIQWRTLMAQNWTFWFHTLANTPVWLLCSGRCLKLEEYKQNIYFFLHIQEKLKFASLTLKMTAAIFAETLEHFQKFYAAHSRKSKSTKCSNCPPCIVCMACMPKRSTFLYLPGMGSR
jgi:hypothetical protein